jgi:hypothetical protein
MTDWNDKKNTTLSFKVEPKLRQSRTNQGQEGMNNGLNGLNGFFI